MFNKLKQIKDLRSKAKHIQGLLKDEIVEGAGGWGKVKVKMSGNQEVLDVTIDPTLKQEEMAKAVKEAVNDAIKKAQRVMVRKMQQSGDLKL